MEGVALLNISDYYVWYVYVFLFAKFSFVLLNLYRSGFILLVVVSNFNFLSHLYLFSRLRIFSTFSHFFFWRLYVALTSSMTRRATMRTLYSFQRADTQLYSTVLNHTQAASQHAWMTDWHWSLVTGLWLLKSVNLNSGNLHLLKFSEI